MGAMARGSTDLLCFRNDYLLLTYMLYCINLQISLVLPRLDLDGNVDGHTMPTCDATQIWLKN